MTEQAMGPMKPAGGRWTRIALALSLGMNLLIAGLVGGTMLSGGRHGGGADVRDLGFGPFTEALSPEDRAALRAAFLAEGGREDGGNHRSNRREIRAELAALLNALRADPFEPEALRALIAQQNNRGRERLELGQRLLADRLVAMSPEARARFADRLEDRLARGPGTRND